MKRIAIAVRSYVMGVGITIAILCAISLPYSLADYVSDGTFSGGTYFSPLGIIVLPAIILGYGIFYGLIMSPLGMGLIYLWLLIAGSFPCLQSWSGCIVTGLLLTLLVLVSVYFSDSNFYSTYPGRKAIGQLGVILLMVSIIGTRSTFYMLPN